MSQEDNTGAGKGLVKCGDLPLSNFSHLGGRQPAGCGTVNPLTAAGNGTYRGTIIGSRPPGQANAVQRRKRRG